MQPPDYRGQPVGAPERKVLKSSLMLTGPAELEFAGEFDPFSGSWVRAQQDVA